MDLNAIFETGLAMLLFALVFLTGSSLRSFRPQIINERGIMSFSAGVSAAYALLYAMPELCGARLDFTASVGMPLLFEGKAVYFLALLGFLSFYGLEHLRRQSADRAGNRFSDPAFRIQIGGFSAYVFLMSYLLAYSLSGHSHSIALFGAAIAFHFLALNHSLGTEFGDAYQKLGRPLLSGMCVAGWATGLTFPLPQYALALLMAFVSGAVIMNSTVMELPTEKDGRPVPFLAGGVLYGLVLLPLG